jgi:hypothetical protein
MDRAQRTVAILALGCFLFAGISTFIDFDCWHQMALARETFALGYVPLADQFAYTPTVYPVVHHEWGTGIVMYALATHGGLSAVRVAQWLLVLLIAATCWQLARRHAGIGVASALAPLAIMMAWAGLTAIRALLFTMLFVALLLTALERDREGQRQWILWWLPLHVVWLNLHAGFIVGLALIAVHTVEQAIRGRPVLHLVGTLVAMMALTAVTPYGSAYYVHVWRALMVDRPLIGEWAPLWSAGPIGVLAYAVSVLVAIYAVLKIGPRASVGWPVVAIGAVAALRHQRNVTLYAVMWFCLVPWWVETSEFGALLRTFWARRVALAAWGAALAIALAADVRNHIWTLRVPANPGDHAQVLYPVGAVDYLRTQHVAANLFVPFEYGAYVSWMLYPSIKVSLDSRYEAAYPTTLLEEHLELYRARPGWRAVLARYPTDAVLVPRGAPVEATLAADADWPRAYEDDAYTIFARSQLGLSFIDERGKRFVGRFP